MINDFIGLPFSEVYVKKANSPTSGFDELLFKINNEFILISVDINTDEILLKNIDQPNLMELIKVKWENRIINKKITGIWKKENQNGYFDFLSIGFNDYIPFLCITSIASELKIGFIEYVD